MTDTSEWVQHDGGEKPVPSNTSVDIVLGICQFDGQNSDRVNWSLPWKYRLTKPSRAEAFGSSAFTSPNPPSIPERTDTPRALFEDFALATTILSAPCYECGSTRRMGTACVDCNPDITDPFFGLHPTTTTTASRGTLNSITTIPSAADFSTVPTSLLDEAHRTIEELRAEIALLREQLAIHTDDPTAA